MTPQRFSALRALLTGRLIAALVRLFFDLGTWRTGDQERFVRQAVPLVTGAQRAMASLTATYVAAVASAELDRPVAPPGIPDLESVALRGVEPAEVYRRPFVNLYTDLSRGKEFPDALRSATVRLEEIAELDLQATHARSARSAMTQLPLDARPSGWRRVLQGPYSCALCVVASTQRYNIENLKQIHPNCDCDVRPIYGDTRQVIDEDALERVHAAVEELTGRSDRGGRAVDYSKILIDMTHEHGELGPMLARPMDRFTSLDDIPRRYWT